MAITNWTRISSGQDGDAVADKFDTVFDTIDEWQEAIQPNITKVPTLEVRQTVVNKSGIHVDTLISEGIYKVNTGLPTGETDGKLTIRKYLELQQEHVLESYTTGKVYKRYYTFSTTSFDAWTVSSAVSTASLILEPQDIAPTHSEGRIYYNNVTKTFNFQGPFAGTEVKAGHENHMHVVNNTGAVIEKGMAVRHNGVAAGKVQVTKALADTFENATVMGLAAQDIANGAEGAITTFGEIVNVNTFGKDIGVPQYLSDTVPGTFSSAVPDIITQVGGVLTADLTAGKFFVWIENTQAIPKVFGFMQGQTAGNETYAVTTTSQDLINYNSTDKVLATVAPTTGIITTPRTGRYNVTCTCSITFPTATSTRNISIEVYDVTNTAILYTYVKNIPRDSTDDSFSFNWPLAEAASTAYKLRIKSNVAISVTFNDISFDLTSISIK